MSGISIQISSSSGDKTSPWRKYGLQDNPFPRSGVSTRADYDAHQQKQVADVNGWLSRAVNLGTPHWSPLAISGSIGVGKTHVLRRMERALREFQDSENPHSAVMVSYMPLTGSGMKSLQLSSLLLETLGQTVPSDNMPAMQGEVPILRAILGPLRRRNGGEVLKNLPDPSPIRKPLQSIIDAESNDEAVSRTALTASWLMRRNLGRVEQEEIGVAGKLESEGQAVRAFAHLCKVAHGLKQLRVWVVLVDQLEDLWRRDVTTALRRTRFLTDLRTLVDEALEGAPVGVTLAWNTEVVVSGYSFNEDVEARLKQDYVALFSRVRDVVRIPLLPEDHALPFAHAYIEYAYAQQSGTTISKKDQLTSRLDRDFKDILANVDPIGRRQAGSLVARAWLDALRAWADKLVSS